MHEIVTRTREQALLVGVVLPGRTTEDVQESLEELAQLTEAAGSHVAGRILQQRKSLDPAYFVGKGKAEEIKEQIPAKKISTVVFDDDLTPAQAKNLDELLKVRVIDRSWVILDIFSRRARTKQAKLQVEIARLQYMLPHLARMWQHLEQQDGGAGRRGGPGETQIEVDRRIARKRIVELGHELESIKKRTAVEAVRRQEAFRVALVGYTNSGKSTLFNRIVEREEVIERDQLFTTLDTTIRKIKNSKGESMVISDTVGFINKLPENLFDAFHSTLSEAENADLILHVIDITSPKLEERIAVVNNLLAELDIRHIRIVKIFNKIDTMENQFSLAKIRLNNPDALFVSALTRDGVDELKRRLENTIDAIRHEVVLKCLYRDIHHLADVYRTSEVLERKDGTQGVLVKIRTRPENVDKFKKMGMKEVKAR